MNVGWLKYLLRDVKPDVEISLKINVGNLEESGEIYADASEVNFDDVEKHDVIYIEANEY